MALELSRQTFCLNGKRIDDKSPHAGGDEGEGVHNMTDEEKTREQLIEELNALQNEVGELKAHLDIERRTVKVMADREFRIKEFRDENEELKARIEEMKGR